MNATTILLLIGAYLLLRRPAATSTQPSSTQPVQGQLVSTAAGATRISLPGVGTYLNVPGSGVSLELSEKFFGGLFGNLETTAPEAEIEPPLPAPVYPQPYETPDLWA